MQTYQTVQGDTFDLISKKMYGNERLLQKLLDANPGEIATIIFEEGTILNIPELKWEDSPLPSPAPWRAKP